VRARFEAGWNVKLPTTKGYDNHEMIEAIHQDKLKAMYLFGEEISLVDSNANYVNEGLSKLEFFVVQIFSSATRVGLRTCIARQPQPGKRRDVYQY
jgi:formate dehydrogenase major subunit